MFANVETDCEHPLLLRPLAMHPVCTTRMTRILLTAVQLSMHAGFQLTQYIVHRNRTGPPLIPQAVLLRRVYYSTFRTAYTADRTVYR